MRRYISEIRICDVLGLLPTAMYEMGGVARVVQVERSETRAILSGYWYSPYPVYGTPSTPHTNGGHGYDLALFLDVLRGLARERKEGAIPIPDESRFKSRYVLRHVKTEGVLHD